MNNTSNNNIIPSETQHDQRLNNIIGDAPPTIKEANKSFSSQAIKFCTSSIGLAFFTFVLIFLLLIFLQPMYIFKKNDDNEFSMKYINYAIVAAIALVAALLVLVIPYFISHKKSVS
jgi:hypothetical protein